MANIRVHQQLLLQPAHFIVIGVDQAVHLNCGNAKRCTFECEEKKCASDSIINAQNAKNLIVKSSGQECLKATTINTPNFGTAKFSMTAPKLFKNMVVNAGTKTESILIDCTYGEGDECKELNKPTRRRLATQKNGFTLYDDDDYYVRAIAANTLTVFFYATQSDNILTKELLERVHFIEQGIKNFDGYSNHSLIYRDDDNAKKLFFGVPRSRALYLESPPGSFLNYIYPRTLLGQLVFDGNGEKQSLINNNIEDTIKYFNQFKDLSEFFDFGFDIVNNPKSKYLAAIYPFGYESELEETEDFNDWIVSFKTQYFDTLSVDGIGFAVADTKGAILNHELYFYMAQDFNLAIASLCIIYLVLYIYCRSLYITTFGLIGVCLCFVPCLAIYHMIWGPSFNIMNMVSVWVILGIGCDDICVFISSYRRAPLESISGEIIPNHLRLAFAFREAGTAMFVTSLTTSCSFFSLCLSTINPLPQFGWFLGSLVLCNFVIAMSWFPCVLQSYVWMVMLLMKYDYHINACNKWLAVAVPLPQEQIVEIAKKNQRMQSIMHPNDDIDALWRRQSVMKTLTQNHLYAHNANDRYKQSSIFFAVPDAQKRQSYLMNIGNNNVQQQNENENENDRRQSYMVQKVKEFNNWRRQSSIAGALAAKLDKNSKNGNVNGSVSAETTFGDCTNLYFIIMRKGLGICLIAFVILMTAIFGYTATLITLPNETAALLPDNTNWGRVNVALSQMDIDVDAYSGYSAGNGGGSSSNEVIIADTPRPTRSPQVPTTAFPTNKPVTSAPTQPTQSPTKEPSVSPTTARPTTVHPSESPTAPTTLSPTASPTLRPTYAHPFEPRYECLNDGYELYCDVEPFVDINGTETSLAENAIAFVFEGGGLYDVIGNNSFAVDCQFPNNESIFYEESEYVSPNGYDVKWCFFDSAPFLTSNAFLNMIAPYSLQTDWYRLSLWLFYDNEWKLIPNKGGDEWYNFSTNLFVDNSADPNALSVEESISIYLVCGTQRVTEYSTDCDGEISSGELILDRDFNIYSAEAQLRWLQLCDALNNINDEVMYRRDADQSPCFAQSFNEYLTNSSFVAINEPMPNNATINRVSFNNLLQDLISQPTSVTFSNDLYNPQDFQSDFGTQTNEEWQAENASIVWIAQRIETQISRKLGGVRMSEYYEKWQDFVDEFNANSPASFRCIQTSAFYVRMEVEVAFLDGFIASVGYTMLLCSIVMIFFSQNAYFVMIIALYILIIVIWIIGVFGAVGKPFGIIEIISVPTVVGLTIDYALHITHAYLHSPFPDRRRRSKSAVNDLGSSVFASAMTTISSMLILYFAKILIFSDLGWIVCSTTTFGVVLALFICPNILMLTGPQKDECNFSVCCKDKWKNRHKQRQNGKDEGTPISVQMTNDRTFNAWNMDVIDEEEE